MKKIVFYTLLTFHITVCSSEISKKDLDAQAAAHPPIQTLPMQLNTAEEYRDEFFTRVGKISSVCALFACWYHSAIAGSICGCCLFSSFGCARGINALISEDDV